MENQLALPRSLQRQTILALNQLGQAVTSSLKLDDVLQRVLIEVAALLKVENVAILMPDGDRLIFEAVMGPGIAHLRGSTLPRASGVAGHVLRTGEGVWLNRDGSNVAGLTLDRSMESISGFRSESLLAVPLRQGGETIGVLEAAHSQPEGLTPDELPALIGAANWASIAIANARLHEQAQKARQQQAQLEERARLARELHDAVTQSLYSMSVLAGAWRRQIEAGQLVPEKEQIAELGKMAEQALREVRLLIYELRPTELQEEGLLGALYRRLEAVEERAGIQTRLVVTDEAGRPYPMPTAGREVMTDFYRLPAPVEQGLYRIAQEALNNVLRHSGASSVCVNLRLGNSTLTMEIKDNGAGFAVNDEQRANGGFGLVSMAERAQHLGGRLSISSSTTLPETGTTVRVESVPYRFVDAEGMIS